MKWKFCTTPQIWSHPSKTRSSTLNSKSLMKRPNGHASLTRQIQNPEFNLKMINALTFKIIHLHYYKITPKEWSYYYQCVTQHTSGVPPSQSCTACQRTLGTLRKQVCNPKQHIVLPQFPELIAFPNHSSNPINVPAFSCRPPPRTELRSGGLTVCVISPGKKVFPDGEKKWAKTKTEKVDLAGEPSNSNRSTSRRSSFSACWTMGGVKGEEARERERLTWREYSPVADNANLWTVRSRPT